MVEEITIKNDIRLLIEKTESEDNLEVSLRIKSKEDCILHWGLSRSPRSSWQMPPETIWPAGSSPHDQAAIRTPFAGHNGESRIDIEFGRTIDFSLMNFALFFPETGSWDNNHGKNYQIRLSGSEGDLSDLTDEIIENETGRNSWTLMHRFNLCHDLLDAVNGDRDGLALLFVWLRYSALRQLDWQRNYNTKPGELSHSQDRLTLKLARIFINKPASRELIRLIMTTLGQGGDGQRIRDDILKIMHRHHIKEVTGHFMEEWHQKLHNNTTPDDIVICEAYLEFLRSDGNLDLFYKTLEAGGVTRERLESFERPIVTPPDFVSHIKHGLIGDFENFLKLLKSVHSGMDIEGSFISAGYLMDDEMWGLMGYILDNRDDSGVRLLDLVERITTMRARLGSLLNSESDPHRVRSMIYLDFALEQFHRTVLERNIHLEMDRDEIVELIHMVLENIGFSFKHSELSKSALHWERLKSTARFNKDWSLHAKSVLDRIGRVISDFSDKSSGLFQPKAELLGKAFKADSYIIDLFSEEILRGGPVFVLSVLVRYFNPILRKYANLGDWQVISPGHAIGKVETVDTLISVQGKQYENHTIIVTDRVLGDEEPPAGVSAVITHDSVDLLSHLAVRARNLKLFFATCYDRGKFDDLKSLKGRVIELAADQSGDVIFEESAEKTVTVSSGIKPEIVEIVRPEFSSYAITSDEFREDLVGGKSSNLVSLHGKLPEWINLPGSAAVPYGVAEKVLTSALNREINQRCIELAGRIDEAPADILAEIRKTLIDIIIPDGMKSVLKEAVEKEGMIWPRNSEDAFSCMKKVWASKWNERAYLSRKTRGIRDEDLFMAVLIQQVVEAEYAFVIHTVNPFTGDSDQLYAEVVCGLGETLVGNYPGRALSFIANKKSPDPALIAYPEKSTGLFGGGLIFRSDSNGEDLTDYAGAGLYDSVMILEPEEVMLNYSSERLIWDQEFRKKFLTAITGIGAIIEKITGSPQDIEGAYAKGKYYVVQTRPQVGI